jgi:hypothetical protein
MPDRGGHLDGTTMIDPGGNVTSAKTGYDSNFPAAYMYTPNIVQIDQATLSGTSRS